MCQDCIMIADAGSTKTDWVLYRTNCGVLEHRTEGINPVRDSKEAVTRIIQEQLFPVISTTEITHIHFYGAGCISPYKEGLSATLSALFPQAKEITVETDLLAAARVLCDNEPGIACILGTGANSCLYDGTNIVHNIPPLGYILGDEGSGAALGKILVNELYKGNMPSYLRDSFFHMFPHLNQAIIIHSVYRQPGANTFLASLVPFLSQHSRDPYIYDLLVEEFQHFLQRNVAHYHRPSLPIHFVGGVASAFTEALTEAVNAEGYVMGRVVERPIEGLMDYHISRDCC